MSAVVCVACGSSATHLHRAMRGHSAMFRSREIWQCDACGMHFAHPMPTNDELSRYNAAYFEHAHGGANVAEAARAFHKAINRVRVEHVDAERQREGIEVRRALEIGPGLGDFCSQWCELHPETEYHVVESDDAQREALLRLGVHAHERVADLPTDTRFDLLVLSHVLEHTSDPRGVLADLVGHLRSGALVFIEVPCRDHEHKPEDEPHLLFFDRAPMARLLERVDVRPTRLSYHGLTLDALRNRNAVRAFVKKGVDRVTRLLDGLGLLSVPPSLAGVRDAAGRAAVRSFGGHREQQQPAWWLRAVGVVQPAQSR